MRGWGSFILSSRVLPVQRSREQGVGSLPGAGGADRQDFNTINPAEGWSCFFKVCSCGSRAPSCAPTKALMWEEKAGTPSASSWLCDLGLALCPLGLSFLCCKKVAHSLC